jgi:hypothetical protein
MIVAMLGGCSGGDDDTGTASSGTGGAASNSHPTSGGAGQAGGSGGQGASNGSGGSAQAGSSTGGSQANSGSGGSTTGDGSGGTGSGGMTGSGGSTGSGGTAAAGDLEKFSFFMISQAALTKLASDMGKPDGFGGDLRYGETGEGAGLRGADKICTAVAEQSMPGSSVKQWRAFLSTTYENAIDRVGEGPWYDRVGRVFAMTKADLLNERPANADPAIAGDFPNEDGVLNHDPDGTGEVDNHDVLTGSNAMGQLYAPDANCADWTSTDGTIGRPRVGHSWIRTGGPGGGFPGGGFPGGGGPGPSGGDGSFNHWISSLDESGCSPGGSVIEMGGPKDDETTVGSGGGYGAFYCFALTP